MTHANRGNVAVICWNTLNSKKWGVTGEEIDGVNYGDKEDVKTLLAIYFPDFVTEIKKGNFEIGDFKETDDDVLVDSTPIRNKDIGERQIVLTTTDDDFATKYSAFDFETNPKKSSKETKTYAKDDKKVVAYVPEEVYSDLDSLKGHKVTVIFGEDNVVALIVVEDDTVNGEFVDKYNAKKDEITINGKKYDFAENAEIYVNDMETTTTMAKVLSTIGEESDKTFTKKVATNVVLDEDGDIERLDLYVSGTYKAFNTIEGVVTKNSKDTLTYYYAGSSWTKDTYDYEDDLEDDKLPRITIDGVKGDITDIEAGNIITMYYGKDKDDVLAIHVSTNIVSGEVTKTKKDGNRIYVDGEEYSSSMKTILATDDEIKDAGKTAVTLGETIAKNDDVELYVNIYGEYVIVRTEEGSTGDWTFAYVRSIKEVDENDADQLVATLRLLLADGSKPTSYSIVVDIDDYNPYLPANDEGILLTKIEVFEDYADSLVGSVIAFKANSDNEIVIDEVTNKAVQNEQNNEIHVDIYDFEKLSLVNKDGTTSKFNKDYEVKEVTMCTEVDDDRETIGDYDFNSGKTKIFVTTEEKVYTKWSSIISNDKLVEKALVVLDGNDIEYMIFNKDIDAESDEVFATYKKVNSDDITLFDGEEKELAHTGSVLEDAADEISENAFVEYTLNSKDEVKSIVSLIDVDAFRDEEADKDVISESAKTTLAIDLRNSNDIKLDVTVPTAKEVYGEYKDNFQPYLNSDKADGNYYAYTLNGVFKSDKTYTVVSHNPALADLNGNTELKVQKVENETDMAVLLKDGKTTIVEIYEGDFLTSGTYKNETPITVYSFNNVQINVKENAEVAVKEEITFAKDLFAVESTGSLKFSYVDDMKDEYGIDSLGTVRVDEDTVVYDLRDGFEIIDFDDFKEIVKTETVYVVPFVNGSLDTNSDANMLVIVE